MKRLFKTLTIVLLIVASALSMLACDGGASTGAKKGLTLNRGTGEELYTLYRFVDEGDKLTVLDIASKAGEKTVGKIVSGAFEGNADLIEVIIPSTVTDIQAGAFKEMNALKKITIPFVGSNANADAFADQTADAENKAVDQKRTFAYIFGNEEYAYGAKITSNYGGGTEDRFIPVHLEEVVVNPANSYQIPMYGFAGVKLVEKITLGDKVIAIGEYAFSGCRDLTALEIPATVTVIYANAFAGCDGLTVINFKGTKEQWNAIDFKDQGEIALEKVVCSDGEIVL